MIGFSVRGVGSLMAVRQELRPSADECRTAHVAMVSVPRRLLRVLWWRRVVLTVFQRGDGTVVLGPASVWLWGRRPRSTWTEPARDAARVRRRAARGGYYVYKSIGAMPMRGNEVVLYEATVAPPVWRQ